MKYRRHPILVDAVQWGEQPTEMLLEPEFRFVGYRNSDGSLMVETPKGFTRCESGDWLIKRANGEFSVCKPDVFSENYSRVELTEEGE